MTFFYGSTEIGLIAKECIKQNGYHICEGHVFVEILELMVSLYQTEKWEI